jgi:hypothetical protein
MTQSVASRRDTLSKSDAQSRLAQHYPVRNYKYTPYSLSFDRGNSHLLDRVPQQAE